MLTPPRRCWQERWFQLTADLSRLVYFPSHKDAFAAALGNAELKELGHLRVSRVAGCYVCR